MSGNLSWEEKGGAITFRFKGSIESNSTTFLRSEIIHALQEKRSDIAIFDMSEATYIDSMGIGMFVHLHVQHHEKIKFIFCGLSGSVSKAFGYVKLISFFDIRENPENVMKELGIADL